MLPLLIIMMYFYLLTSKSPKWSIYIFLQSSIVFNLITQTWTSVFRMYQDCLLQVHRHLPIDLVKSFFTELHKWWALLNSTLSVLFSSWWCFWPLGFQVIHISRSLFRSPSPKTSLMVGLSQGPCSSVSCLLHIFSSHSILLSRAAIALTLTTPPNYAKHHHFYIFIMIICAVIWGMECVFQKWSYRIYYSASK